RLVCSSLVQEKPQYLTLGVLELGVNVLLVFIVERAGVGLGRSDDPLRDFALEQLLRRNAEPSSFAFEQPRIDFEIELGLSRFDYLVLKFLNAILDRLVHVFARDLDAVYGGEHIRRSLVTAAIGVLLLGRLRL